MSRLSRRNFLSLTGAAAAGAAFGRFATACLPPLPQVGDAANWVTQFGFDLYAHLRKEPGDVFVSPFSIETALAMTAAGARGTTATEMYKVLKMWGEPHPVFGDLIKQINRNANVEKPAYELNTANAIWAQQGFAWKPDFTDLINKHYGAGLVPVDFARPEETRQRINAWVEKETRQRITDLIPAGILDVMTRMVLTNTIYFKSAWQTPFEKGATQSQPFFRADGTKADVPLMAQQETCPYHETEELQILELPYTKRELSMVIVLPRKPDGLAAVETKLNAETLGGWAKAAKPALAQIHLPRFKIEWNKELVPALKELGMQTPFSAAADFTGMHTTSEKLFISNVLHKSFVAVDEAGTEAAAATAVVMKRTSAPVDRPKAFRADRPFLFLIRDNKTGATLFLGRYTGPR